MWSSREVAECCPFCAPIILESKYDTHHVVAILPQLCTSSVFQHSFVLGHLVNGSVVRIVQPLLSQNVF